MTGKCYNIQGLIYAIYIIKQLSKEQTEKKIFTMEIESDVYRLFTLVRNPDCSQPLEKQIVKKTRIIYFDVKIRNLRH